MAHRAENGFVGVACGAMDQFASAMAAERRALYVRCATYETEQVPFAGDVLIFDTGVRRSLRASPFNARRRECEEALSQLRIADPGLTNLADATPDQVLSAGLPVVLGQRALHVTQETRRVRSAVQSLRATGKLPGALLAESHESLRDLFDCSSPELDWVVERLLEERGIEGARLTGAGWGGCVIAQGDTSALANAADCVAPVYKETFKREPRTWITRACDGARTDTDAVPGRRIS
jgi:galactokinase